MQRATYPEGWRRLPGETPRTPQLRPLLQPPQRSEERRLIGEAGAVRPVCSRGPVAQPSHRFPFPTAPTNPPLPCCGSSDGGPGAATMLAGFRALRGSSRITQGGRAPQSTRFWGPGELLRAALAARTAIAAKASCSVWRKTACAPREPGTHGARAPRLVGLLSPARPFAPRPAGPEQPPTRSHPHTQGSQLWQHWQ